MKIMILTPYLPHRQVGHGGGTAVRDLVTQLAKNHEVLVVALVRPGEEDRVQQVEELGVQVWPIGFRDAHTPARARPGLWADRSKAWVRAFFSGYPVYVEKYADPRIVEQTVRACESFAPDAIQVEYLQMSLHARALHRERTPSQNPRPRIVLNTHELGSIPRERRAERSEHFLTRARYREEARRWQRLQVDACAWADHTLCVTPEDQRAFAAMGGTGLLTVPLGMDLEAIENHWTPAGGKDLLFVGSFDHRPNRLAAELLVRDVWPEVSPTLDKGRLILAGRGSGDFLGKLVDPSLWDQRRIRALGFVDDLKPVFDGSQLFVAPLPEGGGIKIKILEAMARGIPVVTTPVGAEGIASGNDGVITIAETGPDFVEAVRRIVADPTDATAAAGRARGHIEASFSWYGISERLVHLYAEGELPSG